jgi:hypothetical protein
MEAMARDLLRHHHEAVRITTAPTSRADDIAARQKRYVISMSIRSACFVGAVVAGAAGLTWLWPFLIAAALILPYVAVVMANNSSSKSDGFSLMDHGSGTAALPPGSESARDTGPEHI